MLARNDTAPQSQSRLSATEKKVILTILYHEIFSYPLTLDEILQRVNSKAISSEDLSKTLSNLVDRELIRNLDDHYLAKHRPDWIKKRQQASARCKRIEAKALRRAKFIAAFPFIRGVFFSGTFAKGLMPMGSDVDFFIITAPNRLWLARTLLILFKKIFLFNSRKYFCVNYFINENRLSIDEQNLFTATEIVTLRPAFGKKIYADFRAENAWVHKYYPNFESRIGLASEISTPAIKQKLEQILATAIGQKLDDFFFKKTLQFWRQKFDWMDERTFQIALKSKSYVSKHHPNNFQERVLKKYYFAIEEFEKLHQVRLRLLDLA